MNVIQVVLKCFVARKHVVHGIIRQRLQFHGFASFINLHSHVELM